MAKVILDIPDPGNGEDPGDWLQRIEAVRFAALSLPIFEQRGRLPYGWNLFELHCISTITGQPELVILRAHAGTVDDGTTLFQVPAGGSSYAASHWFGDCPNSYGTPGNLHTTRYTWWQGMGLKKCPVYVMGTFDRPKAFSVQSAGTINRWPTWMGVRWNGVDIGEWSLPFNAINQRKTFVL